MEATARYDAVVLGAGLGGLLAAASLAKLERRVLVIERMSQVGGRFTTVSQGNYQVTTGALHLAPYGERGPFAVLMREVLGSYRGLKAGVRASFLSRGRHVIWEKPFDILKLLDRRGQLDFCKIMAELVFLPSRSESTCFSDWLRVRTKDETIHRMFERFAHFALSIGPDQLSFGEMRRIFRQMRDCGLPSTPEGGCKAVVESLAAFIRAHGGEVRTRTEAIEILFDSKMGQARGVRIKDRPSGLEETVRANQVISDVGPQVTARLIKDQSRSLVPFCATLEEAAGIKLHVVSDVPMIPHSGIMFCLDTRRIAGMVQVSDLVPGLVPSGKFMIDTFQAFSGSDKAREVELAIEDLRSVFGAQFDRHCEVVRTSAFSGGWPVNRAIQGQDSLNQQPITGLIMVGDAYKKPGDIMVEGVAASVKAVLPLLVAS